MTISIDSLSNEELAAEAERAAGAERRSMVELLRLLIEVERRRLHLTLGHSSMFVYCVRALHLSEQAAYSRITAARATRRVAAPLSPTRYLLKLTIGQETHDKLERVRALLRHTVPDGDLATIVDKRLTLLLRETERTKHAAAKRPRATGTKRTEGRRVSASVRRAVWNRDEGRCAFTGTDGRCGERALLEFHHVVPFAAGGPTTVENLQLRCRAHNQHEATLFFGVGPAP